MSHSSTVYLPDKFDFSSEFSRAFDLMENSSEHLFITGNAGTGKTTLLKYFKKNTKKNVAILAPTGLAAINIGGQTIHSFFRLPPGYIKQENIVSEWKENHFNQKTLIRELDVIIIDEVSMVRVDILDGIEFLLRFIKGNKAGSFGGIRMIFLGDLCQLPPVVDDNELKEYFTVEHGGEYFFNAKVFQRMPKKPRYFELMKVYRQKDEEFIRILNKIRNNSVSEEDLLMINSRVKVAFTVPSGLTMLLTPTNEASKRYNQLYISKIAAPECTYKAAISGKFEKNFYPTDPELKLKVGAQVILIKNDRDKRWVNGSIGVITKLSENSIQVQLSTGQIFDIPRETWEKIKYVYNKKEKTIEEEVVGSFVQYPIRLAWAITIHKGQGQTFDRVVIDFGNGAFTHGQAYVALSRCRMLGGLMLMKQFSRKDIIFDKRVDDFRKIFDKIESGEVSVKCQCGRPMDNSFKFCPGCGKALKGLMERCVVEKVEKSRPPTKIVRKPAVINPDKSGECDEILYECLSCKRAELAKEEKVPAYCIFHNTTLRDIVIKHPKAIDDFKTIHGIGVKKINKYAKVFLEAIQNYDNLKHGKM